MWVEDPTRVRKVESQNFHVGASTYLKVSQHPPTRFTANALAQFDKWIGPEGLMRSVHRMTYEKRRKRMEGGEPGRFKLPASSVVKQLIHALEAGKPKARYFVTVPTWIMAVAVRVLPTSLLDRFCIRVTDGEE